MANDLDDGPLLPQGSWEPRLKCLSLGARQTLASAVTLSTLSTCVAVAPAHGLNLPSLPLPLLSSTEVKPVMRWGGVGAPHLASSSSPRRQRCPAGEKCGDGPSLNTAPSTLPSPRRPSSPESVLGQEEGGSGSGRKQGPAQGYRRPPMFLGLPLVAQEVTGRRKGRLLCSPACYSCSALVSAATVSLCDGWTDRRLLLSWTPAPGQAPAAAADADGDSHSAPPAVPQCPLSCDPLPEPPRSTFRRTFPPHTPVPALHGEPGAPA